MRSLDGREREPADRQYGEHLAREIKLAAARRGAFVYGCIAQNQRRCACRQNQIEDAAPAGAADKKAPECRADDESEPVAARPDSEGVRARFHGAKPLDRRAAQKDEQHQR